MRAAVYRGIDRVCMEDVPVPEIGPGEALVRIDCCGVCGTDLKKIHYGLVEPPRIFGHEMAGTIVAIGEGVTSWNLGDSVAVMHHVPCLDCYYCSHKAYAQCPTYKKTGTTAGFEPAGGGFAEFIRVMDWVVEKGMVRVPENVSFEEACFIEPVNTCLKAVVKAKLVTGDTVLVFGQGQIGLIFTQLLELGFTRVITTDPLEFRLRKSEQLGASLALNPEVYDVTAEVKARTEGRGADAAIVTVADTAAVSSAIEAVRPGGKVLLFAQTRLNNEVAIDAGSVCMLEKDLIGSYSSDIGLQDEAARLIFDHILDVQNLVTHRFSLEDISAAIKLVSNPIDGSLKVMVKA